MTAITTRETAGGGATVKGAPLTNGEIDNNFISITTSKLEASNNLNDLTDTTAAKTNLDLASMSFQESDNVLITGGSISGITDISINDGGTGSSTASGARSNLGLGTLSTQDSSNVSITGGTLSGDGSGLTSVDADLLDGQQGTHYLDYNNFTNTPTIGNGTLTVLGGSGLTGSGTFDANQTNNASITIGHADTTTQSSTNNSDSTLIQDIDLDIFGHITSISSKNLTADDLELGNNNSVQHGSLGIGTSATGTTGEIVATNNVTAFFSDDRLKTRLGRLTNALEKISSLDTFYFEPNETAQDLGYEKIRDIGVSAQQVQKILPEIVVPAPIDDKYLTVRYEKMVPLLLKAINELKEEIELLKKSN